MNVKLKSTIFELYHISRTALTGTIPGKYERMQYVKKSLMQYHSNLIIGYSSKQLWFAIEEVLK